MFSLNRKTCKRFIHRNVFPSYMVTCGLVWSISLIHSIHNLEGTTVEASSYAGIAETITKLVITESFAIALCST